MVAGMARSGTSALTGALGLLGCGLPLDLQPPTEFNPKGYSESEALIALLDEVLAAAGTSETDFRPVPTAWFESEAAEAYAAQLASTLAAVFDSPEQIVAIKNPRLCKLFPLLERALDRLEWRIKVAVPFRNPDEVAFSEIRHHGLHPEQGYLMWLRYVLDAELYTRKHPRAFLFYPRLLAQGQTTLAKLIESLSLQLPKVTAARQRAVKDFLDPALRNQVAKRELSIADPDVLPWIEPIFKALQSLEADPYASSALKTFDQVRDEFNRACITFRNWRPMTPEPEAKPVGPGGQLDLHLVELERRVAGLEAWMAGHEGWLTLHEGWLQRHEDETAGLRGAPAAGANAGASSGAETPAARSRVGATAAVNPQSR